MRSDEDLTDQCERIAKECVSYNVRRLMRVVNAKYSEAFAGAGLEPTQFSLLVACRIAGKAPMSCLAEGTRMDRTTLARNLAPLERDGWVSVSPGKDRRIKIVELTDQGREKLDACLDAWSHAHNDIVSLFGDHRLASLVQNMRDLEEAVAG